MIDIHNHILPNIDDGSKSVEMSLNMLKYAYEQGITEIKLFIFNILYFWI